MSFHCMFTARSWSLGLSVRRIRAERLKKSCFAISRRFHSDTSSISQTESLRSRSRFALHLPDWATLPSLELCQSAFHPACTKTTVVVPYSLSFFSVSLVKFSNYVNSSINSLPTFSFFLWPSSHSRKYPPRPQPDQAIHPSHSSANMSDTRQYCFDTSSSGWRQSQDKSLLQMRKLPENRRLQSQRRISCCYPLDREIWNGGRKEERSRYT